MNREPYPNEVARTDFDALLKTQDQLLNLQLTDLTVTLVGRDQTAIQKGGGSAWLHRFGDPTIELKVDADPSGRAVFRSIPRDFYGLAATVDRDPLQTPAIVWVDMESGQREISYDLSIKGAAEVTLHIQVNGKELEAGRVRIRFEGQTESIPIGLGAKHGYVGFAVDPPGPFGLDVVRPDGLFLGALPGPFAGVAGTTSNFRQEITANTASITLPTGFLVPEGARIQLRIEGLGEDYPVRRTTIREIELGAEATQSGVVWGHERIELGLLAYGEYAVRVTIETPEVTDGRTRYKKTGSRLNTTFAIQPGAPGLGVLE